MSREKTEILAHIAAPCSAADDTRYRALAQAYLDFEPSTRISLSPGGRQEAQSSQADSHQPSEGYALAFDRSFLDSTNLSFESASHNLGSPRLRHAATPVSGGPGRAAQNPSWQPPPSVVEDSMPDNNLVLPQFCSPTRILEYYLSGLDSSQSVPSSVARPAPAASQISSSQNFIPQSPEMGLKRPVASAAAPISSDADVAIPSSNDEFLAIEDSIIPVPSTSPGRADSEPPPRKRRRVSPSDDPVQGIERSSSDMGPRQARAKAQIATQELLKLPKPRVSADGLEIYAPDPPVSCGDIEPSTMLTDRLAKLARDLSIEKRFIPKSRSRALRPLERGHWLIDCTGWSKNRREAVWVFLTNYIGTGAAGWGVWCRRNEAFTLIRLYCWAQIIGHMYLVFYLASEREILYTNAKWIGSDGEDVIVMPVKQR